MAEDILLCVDVGGEELTEPWHPAVWSEDAPSMRTQSRLDVVKEGLRHFVQHKARFSNRHRFGVCMLSDDASWVLDFTTEEDIVQATINSMEVLPSHDDSGAFEFDKLVAPMMMVGIRPPSTVKALAFTIDVVCSVLRDSCLVWRPLNSATA